MNRASNPSILVLSPQMMHIPVSWARAEGWNPGLDDCLSFYAADNQGFLALFEGNKAIATISAVNYGNVFGFIGFYIVDPEYRGLGYGRLVWDYAINRLIGIPIGLDGVVMQQDFYARSGFKLAHRNIRFKGIARNCQPQEDDFISPRDIHYQRLCDYDSKHFGCTRDNFLQAWLLQSNAQCRILMQDGRILAFGCIRKCFEGYKIGPLFADDFCYAERMLQYLISSIPEKESYYLDVPQPNAAALRLAEQYDMQTVFETARMYLGPAPKLPLDNIYGITSFELG
ncbi:MAG: GNAT family N-acetyltransferase [Candidatus Cloacimonetes bacterium]|nr:GNAT family N-acetyltransferase [Candidatus Cloacimonadota bacterium]